MACRCNGWTARDISPWCEKHATPANLTAQEIESFIAQLRTTIKRAEERIKVLQSEEAGVV